MKMNVLVGSMTLGTLVEVEGVGMTQVQAQQNAVNIARSLHHIPDPVAIVDNHKSALVIRSVARRELRERMDSMPRERMVPFSGQSQDPRYRH